MITIIADSGSTKTDWRILSDTLEIAALETVGFNPVLIDTSLIVNELKSTFSDISLNQSVEAVFYYGAGCWNIARCSIVLKALEVYFPNAEISVTNDLIGAARAVCGQNPGIACILGTGANSCLYDGQKVIDNVPALGFIMGDEGSGAYLGKQLLQSYFYRSLPKEIEEKLLSEYEVSKKILLDRVYNSNEGNKYLAIFAKFIIKEKEHPFVLQLIKDSFDAFIKKQLLKYENVGDYPIHFIGSIAYFLQDILKNVLENNGLQLGRIIRHPIEGLIDFHKISDKY